MKNNSNLWIYLMEKMSFFDKGVVSVKDSNIFYIIALYIKYVFVSFTKGLTSNFISPSLYLLTNHFVLKMHLLLIFFFPVCLVLFMFFDSFLTIDYIFFFYTDEADFDDFIAVIYMVLFVFLMLTDYDFNDNNTYNTYDYVESFTENVLESNVNTSDFVYYDKNFFSKGLMVSSSSIQTINNLSLLNSLQIKLNNKLLSKIPVNRYILDDAFAIELDSEKKFVFLKDVTVDEYVFNDSSDIFVYSLYLILFDLELSRLFLFINSTLLQWTSLSLNYFKHYVNNTVVVFNSIFETSLQLKFLTKGFNGDSLLFFPSMHKIYLTNFLYSIIEDALDSDYDNWFLNRNTYGKNWEIKICKK